MVDPRWEEVKSIAGRAGELVGRERDEFLRAACRGDASLEAEIRGLVEAADVDDSFLAALDTAAPRPRFELGEFRLLRELGRGASSIVYLARQERLNREVAVKVLVEGPLTSRTQVERFHREARAVARLRHPGIVRVLSDGQIDGTHWFAMEFVNGHDLARELELQRGGSAVLLPPRGSVGYLAAVARLCADVADALHHAHQQGLVHRDVKPQNLLLDAKGAVQVVDFGLARDMQSEDLTRAGDLLGTLVYMSPEQARAEGPVDPRTDVYSLGAVLYELCTGRRPIEGRSLAEHLRRLQDDHPPRPRSLVSGLPRDLERICLAALAKDKALRYPDAGALGEDLRRFLRDEPIHGCPGNWLSRVRFSMRRNRKLLVAGGLVGSTSVASFLFRPTAHAGGNGWLSVEFTEPNGASHACPVSLRRIDPIWSMPGTPAPLGSSPVESAEVPPGYYRVVHECELYGRREFTREILAEREQVVRARFERLPERAGMVLILGGTLALRDVNAPLVALNGLDVVIEPFLMDACEVTIGEYARFLAESGHPPPQQWQELHRPDALDLPMVYVTWRDALAYAEWCGKRLPTYAEWNWVARGAEGRRYPWGSEGPIRGNAARPLETELDGLAAFFAKATRVGSFAEAASPSGVHDLFGNVAEWTESPVAVPDEDGFTVRMEVRIYAGHAWDAASWGKRGQSFETFSFGGLDGPDANHRIGFRCVL